MWGVAHVCGRKVCSQPACDMRQRHVSAIRTNLARQGAWHADAAHARNCQRNNAYMILCQHTHVPCSLFAPSLDFIHVAEHSSLACVAALSPQPCRW